MEEQPTYSAADAMTYRPLKISPQTPLADVEVIFAQSEHDCVAVCDRDGALVGVVTRTGMSRVLRDAGRPKNPRRDDRGRRPAASIMMSPVVAVTPETPLRAVLARMEERRLESVPVVIGALPIGMIRRRDVRQRLRGRGEGRSRTWTIEPSSIR